VVSLASVASELVVTDIAERVVKGWKTILAEARIVQEEVEAALLHNIEALICCASPYY
jgi:hypothetical protein